MTPETFIEISIILVLTVAVSGIMRLLKQPLIIGYIVSGIIAGPVVLDIMSDMSTIATFSQIGIVLLLFMVGLGLNPKVLKELGKVSFITGVGQVLFTSIIGYFICRLLDFSVVSSLYLSIALAFSSTIIIMKLLSDKKELESLHGRISVGFLIVQDFIAIAILMVISSMNEGSDLKTLITSTIPMAVVAILILGAVSIYVMPALTRFIAKSQEFLLLFSASWCFAIAIVFHMIDFSIEAGALLAGIALSMTPYHHEISAKMKPLRDFFLILFFIMLGSQMTFSNIAEHLLPMLLLSAFVLIGNPLIVLGLMGLMGYTKRTSFMTGLAVAQISEFSLVVITMGVTVGHVSKEILSLATAVGLITIAGSSYLILYSEKIYPKISRYLSIFEKKGNKVDSHTHNKDDKIDIILFGYNRIGFDILESLKKMKQKFLVIDYDPEVIVKLTKMGYPCKYGDADDYELLEELDLSKAKMIISTIPVIDTNLLLISKARSENKDMIISVVSHQVDEAMELYEHGATYVIMPHFLGGKHVSTMIEDSKFNMNKFLKHRILHMENLKYRKEAGHEHPRHEH